MANPDHLHHQHHPCIMVFLNLHGMRPPSLLHLPYAWLLVALTGGVLLGAGMVALALAATINLMPYDIQYLGMSVAQLCSLHACRIVHFMTHDRVAFGGSLMAVGGLYIWLAAGPLRRAEAWAWWTLFISAMVGFASFLTYLGYGYLDLWHGRTTLVLLPLFTLGIAGSYGSLGKTRSYTCLFRRGLEFAPWTTTAIGFACLVFTAVGMIAAGLVIMTVGMTHVFVPQDLEYMGVSEHQLYTINPRLISLIAHDRAGFGGGICSTGIAVLLTVWCGLRPGARRLWITLLLTGLVGFGAAIGVHPAIGYTSFSHLLPAYIGAAAFLVGIMLLYIPICGPKQ